LPRKSAAELAISRVEYLPTGCDRPPSKLRRLAIAD